MSPTSSTDISSSMPGPGGKMSSPSISSSSSSGVSSDCEHSCDEEESLYSSSASSSSSSDHRRHASSSTSVSSTDLLMDPHSPVIINDQHYNGLDCYTFIPDGDFDIVWVNVIAFVIGHLIHFYSLYVLFTTIRHDITIVYTWFWSE